MRADLANSNGDATALHVVGEGEGKGSAPCRQAEGSRRIACESRVIGGAAKCSPSHIHPPDRSEQDRLALNRHRCGWGQETTDRTHATGSIPFGRLSPDTALAKNRADNPSGRPG